MLHTAEPRPGVGGTQYGEYFQAIWKGAMESSRVRGPLKYHGIGGAMGGQHSKHEFRRLGPIIRGKSKLIVDRGAGAVLCRLLRQLLPHLREPSPGIVQVDDVLRHGRGPAHAPVVARTEEFAEDVVKDLKVPRCCRIPSEALGGDTAPQ